jgi:hypothetical protein
LLSCFVGAPARARDALEGSEAPPRVRALFTAGGQLGLTYDSVGDNASGASPSAGSPVIAYGLGLSLQAGVQLGDHLDVAAEVSAASIVFASYLRAVLAAGWTPSDWITLSAGPVVREVVGIASASSGDTFQSVGGTARVDLHLAPSHFPTAGAPPSPGDWPATSGPRRGPARAASLLVRRSVATAPSPIAGTGPTARMDATA